MKVSSVLSIHNRSTLFGRALDSYLWQTMSPEEWEIILVDDMSTEDLSKVYQRVLGRVNLRHVRMDHRKHFMWKRRNPDWKPGDPEDWFHTPAISNNVGFHLARGSVICLCHPEILHSDRNFEYAWKRLAERGAKSEKSFLFGRTYLGTLDHNLVMTNSQKPWNEGGWKAFLDKMGGSRIERFKDNELYWYTSFLPKVACEAVRGVDFEFLNGVAGEDDDFKYRVHKAGWCAVPASEIEGFHQNHDDEKEAHRNRKSKRWEEALERNRELLRRRSKERYELETNYGWDWTAKETIVEITEYRVGSTEPLTGS